MPKAYYDNTISGFLGTSDETILGRLMISDEFRTTIEQKNSWRSEIEILKRQLRHVPDGSIIFEYTIPRIGDRIDVTCIINGIIFALEFKVNNTEYLPADEEQVVDYALDLKFFHEESERRHIVPMLIATDAAPFGTTVTIFDDKILDTILRQSPSHIPRQTRRQRKGVPERLAVFRSPILTLHIFCLPFEQLL